jgi:hypothetical protein
MTVMLLRMRKKNCRILAVYSMPIETKYELSEKDLKWFMLSDLKETDMSPELATHKLQTVQRREEFTKELERVTGLTDINFGKDGTITYKNWIINQKENGDFTFKILLFNSICEANMETSLSKLNQQKSDSLSDDEFNIRLICQMWHMIKQLILKITIWRNQIIQAIQ